MQQNFYTTYYYLPGHIGKLKKPGAHASHLSLVILALQLHTPLLSHVGPFEPSSLQLHSEIIRIVHQIFLRKVFPPSYKKIELKNTIKNAICLYLLGMWERENSQQHIQYIYYQQHQLCNCTFHYHCITHQLILVNYNYKLKFEKKGSKHVIHTFVCDMINQ